MADMTLEEALAAADVDDAAVVNDIITIDPETRKINVPDSESIFGVETDMDVERKYFRCPRIVGDKIDLSSHKIFISYTAAKDVEGTFLPDIVNGSYLCDDVTIDGDYINFSWLLSDNVLSRPGIIAFKVLAKKNDGEVLKTRWNTAPAFGTVLLTVHDGDDIAERYPDIVTQLLERMDAVEAIATDEAMQGYVAEYMENHPVVEGATAEQAAQIEQNKNDVTQLKRDLSELSDEKANQTDVDELKSDLIDLEEASGKTVSKNLLDWSKVTMSAQIDTKNNGNVVSGTNIVTDYINCKLRDTVYLTAYRDTSFYSITSLSPVMIAEYDSDNNLISYVTWENSYVVSNSNTAKIRMTLSNNPYNTNPFTVVSVTTNRYPTSISDVEPYGVTKYSVIENIECAISNSTIDFIAPPYYYAVVGYKPRLYYQSLMYQMYGKNIRMMKDGYGVIKDRYAEMSDATSSVDYYTTITPFIMCESSSKGIIPSIKIKFKAVEKTMKNGESVNVMFIGDSMIYHAYAIAEFVNLCEKNGVTVDTIGTMSKSVVDNDNNERTIKHEGRFGWSTNDYVSSESYNENNNAFYNNGTFDFSNYISANGISKPDYVFIQLGVNDENRHGSGTSIENLTTIINSIHNYDSNIKIGIAMIIPPYLGDGSRRKNEYNSHLFRLNFNKNLIDAFNDTNNVFIVPISLYFDSTYGFSIIDTEIGNYITEKIRTTLDPVHPSKEGYYQLGLGYFCTFMCN